MFSVGFLLFFIFRTLFKFALYAHYSSYVMWIKETDFDQLKGTNLQSQTVFVKIHEVTSQMICGMLKRNGKKQPPEKAYRIIPFIWFIPAGYAKQKLGNLFCAFSAIVATLIVIFWVW
jgi:hypothetical protein